MKTQSNQELYLGNKHKDAVGTRIQALGSANFSERLWEKDTSLWGGAPAANEIAAGSMGWLASAGKMEEEAAGLIAFKEDLLAAGFTHAVLLGMGGSSMAPMVFRQQLAPGARGLSLEILDTTDPATILGVERRLPLDNTLFIVASKSGTTTEPLALMDYFYNRLAGSREDPGKNFISITDPGSWLEQESGRRGFRRVFAGIPDIGGRYSAISPFGMVPAALAGLDLGDILGRARKMVAACQAPESENPGIVLGAAIGELARRGHDKLTLFVPEEFSALGLWLEQLLAESTGKAGTGILPVAGEPIGPPGAYGNDRIFAGISLAGSFDEELDNGLAVLEGAGHPVIRITLEDSLDIAGEFMRWEVATATAGAVLGINPFDQPNVQESKDNTNSLLDRVKQEGGLVEAEPSVLEDPISIYAEEPPGDAAATLDSFLAKAHPGDYICLMAYLPEDDDTDARLKSIRLTLRDALNLATTSGYGPRFLHSTGQFHKGGPDTGIYLQLTADDAQDAPVPGSPFSFSVIKRAQALGDLQALRRHGRRAIRIHLGGDAVSGLKMLDGILDNALKGT